MSVPMDEKLLRDFLDEADERVEALLRDLRDLRARRTEGRARREILARVFRHVHTIKGTASAAGLARVAGLAHEFETLLDAARAGGVEVDDELIDASEAAVEALAEGLGRASRGGAAGDERELVARLRRLSGGVQTAARTDGGRATGAGDARTEATTQRGDAFAALDDVGRRRVAEAVAEGARSYVVAAEFSLEDFDERVRALVDALSEAGEVVATIPDLRADAPERVCFLFVHTSAEGREEVSARLAPFGARLLEGTDEGAGGDAGARGEGDRGRRDAPALSSLASQVRVPLEELDELISATHGLHGDTGRALEGALEHLPAGDARARLEAQARDLRRRFHEVEARLIGARMVAARGALERAARAGEAAARASGREVEFETRGGEVRLDKLLAEAVSDPLLHLARNAVDHGIEPPGERAAAGKGARGRVRLEAVAGEAGVVLRVADDGRGIDPEAVARAARERGIIGPSDRVTQEQSLRLIFRPGFSTAGSLSTVSGRGVGLDVVERAVEEVGGEMRVWTQTGAGTTFEMRLPPTLAIVPSLVLSHGGERYCVAAAHVEDCLDASDAREAGDGPRGEKDDAESDVLWRGARLRVVALGALLGRDGGRVGGGDDTQGARIIVSRVAARESGEGGGEACVGVLVDGAEEAGELLVRGLGRRAGRWRGISGAAELRDGRVALALDLPRLLEIHL
jgi:two-component system chemotaxis sensor kinase CheA